MSSPAPLPGHIPLVSIRPAPGDMQTLALFAAQGFAISSHPLFEVRPEPWSAPDPADHDALIITSANALRHGGPELQRLTSLPVCAVGEKTAQLARKAGFRVSITGKGGIGKLLPLIEQQGFQRPLRLMARDHMALPEHGLRISERIVYRSDALPMDEALAAKLQAPAMVLLHSARAAQHFADQCTRLAITRYHHHLLCFAASIAAAAGPGWAGKYAAITPDDKAMLALAQQLCKDS